MGTVSKAAFLTPVVVLFGFFFLFPLVVLVVASLHGDHGFTVHHYTQVITNKYYYQALLNSLWLSFSVTLTALVISGVLAFYLARHDFPGKTLYFTLLTFPISFPGVVVGFMIIILFGTTGIVPLATNFLFGQKFMVYAYSIHGIFLAYLYFEIPRVVMTLYGAVKDSDRTIEEAARTMGATPWQAIRHVVLPAIFPIFISAGALAFSTSMSAFGTAYTLANQFEILPIVMYNEYTLNFNIEVASALAVVIGSICVLMNITYRTMLERGKR